MRGPLSRGPLKSPYELSTLRGALRVHAAAQQDCRGEEGRHPLDPHLTVGLRARCCRLIAVHMGTGVMKKRTMVDSRRVPSGT